MTGRIFFLFSVSALFCQNLPGPGAEVDDIAQ